MVNLLKRPVLLVGALVSTGLLAAAQGSGGMAQVGTVNYIEGHAAIDGRALSTQSLKSTIVAPGQTLTTEMGSKAEMLLTPGVVLRLGDNSGVRMVTPSLTNTQVDLQRGTAMVEVDMIAPENHLVVADHGSNIRLEKKGLYSFNADQPLLAVYDGKASVQIGDKSTEVGRGKELTLQPEAKLKTQSFDRNQEGDLYAWSRLRSEYMAEANGYSAQTILVSSPGWWYGTGWYWNPYFDSWAFVPGAGYLYSPFGFGFFSPGYAYYGGFGGLYHGYRGVYPGRGLAGRPAYSGGFRGAPAMGHFSGGMGGGFHGGGGRR